jgi:O-6-methylguanine DNA methyltransferase
MTTRFAIFDAPVGRCAVLWRGARIVGVQLPEAREAALRARIAKRYPAAVEAAPPRSVQRAMDAVSAALRGEARDLSRIELDMSDVPPFHRRVYEAARAIVPGRTITYGELAARIGSPGAARAVGQALGRNPFAIVVPCHRVLAAGGRLGGFSANGGVATKLRLLRLERAFAQGELDLTTGGAVLGYDPSEAVRRLQAQDAALAALIDEVGPCTLRLSRAASVFDALAESIVYQQLTGRAAATIHARLCALFPGSHGGLLADRVLRASDEKLLSAGLSRAKMQSLRDLARRSVSGELPEIGELADLDDDTIVERLTIVRGVGRWTVEMLLIFRLGRPDVLPLDDYGVRKGFGVVIGSAGLPTKKALEAHGERWRPYRSVASWYLWRAAELSRR